MALLVTVRNDGLNKLGDLRVMVESIYLDQSIIKWPIVEIF